MTRLRVALILVSLWSIHSPAQSPDVERGAALYDICGACHGPHAQGTESLGAPPLAGQQRGYLLRQLRNFKSGARGGQGDVQGRQMQQILATVHEESDWRAVIEFIMTLPVRRADAHAASEQHAASEPHTATDLHAAAAGERARQIYGTCAACHGIAGDGNEALQAPSLASLPAWYIAAQLHKFRKGSRGAAASDGPGRSMRAIAATLTSDRDIAAVSDYIALTLASP